jgi:hypothetical protein
VSDLLIGGQSIRQGKIRELMKDQFVAELLPFVSKLNGTEMSSILTEVRELLARPRNQRIPLILR